jgi:galactose-6-phosphate isomerase
LSFIAVSSEMSRHAPEWQNMIAVRLEEMLIQLARSFYTHSRLAGTQLISAARDFIRTHYPIYGRKVGKLVATGEADLGVCICGTGIGINNAAQKVKGVRAACVADVQTAVAAKENLNANVIGCGGRVIGIGSIEYILEAFLKAEYKPTPEKEALIAKIDGLIGENDCIENDHLFDEYLQKWDEGYYHD